MSRKTIQHMFISIIFSRNVHLLFTIGKKQQISFINVYQDWKKSCVWYSFQSSLEWLFQEGLIRHQAHLEGVFVCSRHLEKQRYTCRKISHPVKHCSATMHDTMYKLTWLLYLVRTVSISFANFTDFGNWEPWLWSCSLNCVNSSSLKSSWKNKTAKNRPLNNNEDVALQH